MNTFTAKGNKLSNTNKEYLQAKQEFNTQLSQAIKAKGGINITQDGKVINDILLAEPKGLYAVDEDELLTIELILQCVESGAVKAYTKEFGEVHFEFDYVGSKSQCYKYLHKQEVKNKIDVAKLLTNHIDRIEDKKRDDHEQY